MALLQALADLCLDVVERLGLPGVFLLMVGESMILPIPSEAVMPPAGWLAYEGRMSFWGAFVAGTLGTVVGSLLSYEMGKRGLRPFLERHGRKFLVSRHHLDLADRFFERRGAEWAVFLSRFIPVVRHLISIPAGSARMPMGHFLLATTVGGAMWNLLLLWAGYKLGTHWERVVVAVEALKVPILVFTAVAVLVVFVVVRRRNRKVVPVDDMAKPAEAAPEPEAGR